MTKITLATLPKATPQEVFNQGVKHLLSMDEPAIGLAGVCMYRTETGFRCVGGCFISDEEYSSLFDDIGDWSALVREGLVPEDHCELISGLQIIHDEFGNINRKDKTFTSPENYKSLVEKLKSLASEFNLEYVF